MKQQTTIDPAIETGVEELLLSMTLEEKAAQMVQIPYSMVPKEEALDWARKGAGSFLHVLGTTPEKCSPSRFLQGSAFRCCSGSTPFMATG